MHEISPGLIRELDAYWRAANYLSVGQIYLLDNPLLKEALQLKHIKPRLLGHFGTTPGLNFIYAHLNRIISQYDLNMIYICGPGHGGPGMVANAYLEGTYSEFYPEVSQNEEGMRRLFKQFSFPGGIPSHVAAEIPGSIHEGGELGYALSHAFGAAFDNPELIVACVVGDGEAETGALATSWHSNKFLNVARDGVVLPILHLNGYKIAGPTVLARIPKNELDQLFRGYGYHPYYVEGEDHEYMHKRMWQVLDEVVAEIQAIKKNAHSKERALRQPFPMIVLRSPKGWTGPKFVDNLPVEGSFRSHQVPLSKLTKNPEQVVLLEEWLKSYRPHELFDSNGCLQGEIAALAPHGGRRMSANPHANGGLLLQPLKVPDFRSYAISTSKPGTVSVEPAQIQGKLLCDALEQNLESRNFRIFSPDETASNRLEAVFEVTERMSTAEIVPTDQHVSSTGRVLEMLSEHQCQGWLEGYLLTGRHGVFSCYEAFVHIIDSMFNQYAKWLKSCSRIPWRKPIASFNYFLSSHVWRQDHNGFSHQDPGFIDHVVNKSADIIRVYLPPDANCLLSVTDHCLRSYNYINVIIYGKHPAWQWLDIEAAVKHCAAGIGIWKWASNDNGATPDVVMACCGDVPTLETLAAVSILNEHLPDLKIRVVNVVDLMKLESYSKHPHGLTDMEFDGLFTPSVPIIFAFHGYAGLIHRLTYRRANHSNLHVKGFKEEGTTTTPFDMVVLNQLDRFHLVQDVIERVPPLEAKGSALKKMMHEKILAHGRYIREHGEDMPEVQQWRWKRA